MIDARDMAIHQARQLLTHPWNGGAWFGWWNAGLQMLATDPAGWWGAALAAQARNAEAYLKWLEDMNAALARPSPQASSVPSRGAGHPGGDRPGR